MLEHLVDPGAALDQMRRHLEPKGALYLTVPDAGSRLARTMGRRWWSVLPMHLQYFTRGSMRRLLDRHGFDVRWVATHPKVFSGRYYAERAASFAPVAGKRGRALASAVRLADRLVAPDFRDRLQVIAIRP